MTVQQLIDVLSKCNPDATVFLWDDGVRRIIDPNFPIDQWDQEDKFVDINVAV